MYTNRLLLLLQRIRLRDAVSILLYLSIGSWLTFKSVQISAPPFTAPVTPVSHAESGKPPLKPQAIEALRVGQRVWGENPNREEVDTSLPEPDQATWRSLALQMVKPDGEVLDIVLLRHLDWIEATRAAPGATIELDLPELGASGPVKVLAVEPSPPIQSGPGHVITGTFAHRSSNQLLNITVEGEVKPIGVTDNHPIWSEDRQEFVEAGQLEVGESLLTLAGPAPITSIAPRGPPEPVYNLEIHGEHVYCVTTAGVLVHNNCTTRIRHYTNRAGSEGIRRDGVIKASDQNSVFAENARGRPLSPRDAENKYGIKRGHGRDYIETDVPTDRINRVWNDKFKVWELKIEGDVPLLNPTIVTRR